MAMIFLIKNCSSYRLGSSSRSSSLDNLSATLSGDEGSDNDSEPRVTPWIKGTHLSEQRNIEKSRNHAFYQYLYISLTTSSNQLNQ